MPPPLIVHEESRKTTYDREGIVVERVFHVSPYSRRLEFVEAMLGNIRQIGRQLIRTAPGQDPWYPWCYAVSCVETGLGHIDGAGINQTDHSETRATYSEGARYVVTYKTIDNEEEASESYDFAAVQLTLPNQRMGWNDTATPSNPVVALMARTDTGGTKTMPRIQYAVTKRYVPRLPLTAITTQLGRINKRVFKLSDDATWPVETVRFESLSATRKWTVRGAKFYEVTYKFAIQPIYDTLAETNAAGFAGWNRLFRPDTGKWQYVGLAADPTKRIYMLDEDGPTQVIRGVTYSGFDLLFQNEAR